MKNGKIENEDEAIVIKCDPGCGWYLHVNSIDEVEEWLNRSCPQCKQEGIITPTDMVILRNTQKMIEKTFGGEIRFPVDTAISRNLKEAKKFDIFADYPRKRTWKPQ